VYAGARGLRGSFSIAAIEDYRSRACTLVAWSS
jgi:hypothetical protein